MSTKDLALRIVKDQFGILAEVGNRLFSHPKEVCRFVSNQGHPTFPEILRNARNVFKSKTNDAKVSLLCRLALLE